MSSILNKLYYNTWNIGFVEKAESEVINDGLIGTNIHWLKHPYKDRFFADPFFLSVQDDNIEVLVEEFKYYHKKGVISLLRIDKQYNLIEKRVICNQPYHQSYPFIIKENNIIHVIPEASQSGALYMYDLNKAHTKLENRSLLINEPLLDSTFIQYEGLWWIFATKRGQNPNKNLYIYFSQSLGGPYIPHSLNPVKEDLSSSRPAGNVVNISGDLYRVAQVCMRSYGETVQVCKLDDLSETTFKESCVKKLNLKDKTYGNAFHTLNSMDNLCVIDGIRKVFTPIRRVIFEITNLFFRN